MYYCVSKTKRRESGLKLCNSLLHNYRGATTLGKDKEYPPAGVHDGVHDQILPQKRNSRTACAGIVLVANIAENYLTKIGKQAVSQLPLGLIKGSE